MLSQGPLSPTVWSQAQAFSGDQPWNLPTFPTSCLTNVDHSYNLIGTGLGFSIPTGAIIYGYVVRWTRQATGSGTALIDTYVRLYTGSMVGTDHSTYITWPLAATQQVYGGSSDLWGLSLAASDINASSFGALIRFDNNDLANRTGIISAMDITVYYDPPPVTFTGADAIAMGDAGTFQAIVPDNAAFVSQATIPLTLLAGQFYKVELTFNNNGPTTWNQGTVFLSSQNPAHNSNWGVVLVGMPDASIAPTQNETFSFSIQAPTTPGVYHFQWRLYHSGQMDFGDYSTDVDITVVANPVFTNPLNRFI